MKEVILLSNYVEGRFLNWAQRLNLDFNPNIFTLRYQEYTNEFSSKIKDLLRDLFDYISKQLPNVDFYIRGRFKSEVSYLNKTIQKLDSAISSLFNGEISEESKMSSMQKYFGFLKESNYELYIKIISIYKKLNKKRNVHNPDELRDALSDFKQLISDLQPADLNTLIRQLGQTEDLFAYRIIVQSVRFNIKDIRHTKNGSFEIIDESGRNIPISPSIKINPQNISPNAYGKKYINLGNTQLVLNDRNFVYDPSIPQKNRTLANAKKDANGNLTYLGDAIILPNGEFLDINSIFYSEEYNSYFIGSNGEFRNLSGLLRNYGNSIQLTKNDSENCIEYVKLINTIANAFLAQKNYTFLEDKAKNYIDNPKPISHYQSLHNSFLNETFDFNIEEQIRTLEMDDNSRTENIPMGHNNYKKQLQEEIVKNSPILNEIKKYDATAFGSSADTIMELLSSHPFEIGLTEVLPSYILIGKFKDAVCSYVPELEIVFNHFFQSVPEEERNKVKISTGLSFKNYQSYKESRLALQKDLRR